MLGFVSQDRAFTNIDSNRSCFRQSVTNIALANNLVAASMPREAVDGCLAEAGFKDKIRPQELANDQWRQLYDVLRSAKIIH